MNKKFNLLALAAAASACGALVLTSCGGGGETHLVLFKTDGLKNVLDAAKPTAVKIKSQKVKHGKMAKSPIDPIEAGKKYARYTYKVEGGELVNKPLTLQGWSESTEDETTGSMNYRRFDFTSPITGDTVLYPLYSDAKVHCLTVKLRQNVTYSGTWNKTVCDSTHVWDENWFETNTALKGFDAMLKNAIIKPSNMEIDKWTYIDKDTEEETTFNWETATITEDLTITAHYKAI